MWRWLVLLATLWPLVYAALFFGDVLGTGAVSWLLHLGTIFWLLGLLAISLVDVFRNPELTESHRTVWAVALVAANMLALPVYWLLHARGPRPSV